MGAWSVQPLASDIRKDIIHSKKNNSLPDTYATCTSSQLHTKTFQSIESQQQETETLSTPLPVSKKPRQDLCHEVSPLEDVADIHQLCINQEAPFTDSSKIYQQREVVNFPAKELFKNVEIQHSKCKLPPSSQNDNLGLEGYDTPWGLKSPVSIF